MSDNSRNNDALPGAYEAVERAEAAARSISETADSASAWAQIAAARAAVSAAESAQKTNRIVGELTLQVVKLRVELNGLREDAERRNTQ